MALDAETKKSIERYLLSCWNLTPWIDGVGEVTFWNGQITVSMTPSRFKWDSDDFGHKKDSFKHYNLELRSYEMNHEDRKIHVHFFYKEME